MTLDEFLQNYQPKGTQKQTYGTAGSILGGLGSLYMGNQAIASGNQYLDSLDQNQRMLQERMSSMPTLDSMYGMNSPYAQQLQQTLARKDAAAGRNSQYGQRAVQLQAALADKGSAYAAQQAAVAEALSKATNTNGAARNTQNMQNMQIRGQQLGSLFDMANKSGALAPVNQFLNDTVDKGLNYLFPQTQMGGGSGQAANPMQLDPMQQQQQTLGLQTPDYTPNDTWSNNSGGQQYWYE